METQITKGEYEEIEPRWYHIFLVFTTVPVWILLAVITVLVFIADFLLLDTHHFTFKAVPKWKK